MEKFAVVTGSSSGLGLKTAGLLISKNFFVFAWDVKETPLDSSRIKSQIVDVTNTESISTALSIVLKSTSKIDVLVNAAGISMLVPTISRNLVHPLESFEKILKVNLIGTFDVTRQVSLHMNKGVVILVASINASQANRYLAAYGASKGAVASMALPMARDLAFKGTRVVSICPGAFSTQMTQSMNPRSKIAVLKAIPGGRFGEAEEFAHAVWFAVENDYLNGCNLEISGGLINPNI